MTEHGLTMQSKRSKNLVERARKVMPAGVSSPVRAFGAVGGDPIYITRAEGAIVTDVDGNSYIDYVCSWGPLILGHCHPEVLEAIERAAAHGTSYGAPHEGEITLAEAIVEAMPWIEMLRFVNSGTEAAMSALRLARAATGRSKIVKFEGNYHGHVDYLLVKAGSGVATFGLPDSSGVPPQTTRDSLVAPFNHLDAVENLFKEYGEAIAAVIVEPVAGNMGVIPPAEGFLTGLRQLTQSYGALLIFDEVITGFRVSRGGAAGLYDVKPDLVCLGKIIGGGLPVGAYGGDRHLMELVAPLGPVYQAGTLSGNPLAMAAGLATIRKLTPELYATFEIKGKALQQGLREAANRCGIAAQVNRVGSMLSLFFLDHPVNDSNTAFSTDRTLYGRLFHALLRRGVYLPPSALESWFVGSAHSESLIERTLKAFTPALQEAVSN
ncbi:MAG: glutamate-1-semialdehyde 2,1-aminomutase [Acidobacteriota bacterium]